MDSDRPGSNLQDTLIPGLEISIIPSKFSSTCKVDLFGVSEEFLKYLALQSILPGDHNDDVQAMPLEDIPEFIHTLRDQYRKYRAAKV